MLYILHVVQMDDKLPIFLVKVIGLSVQAAILALNILGGGYLEVE